MQINLAGVIVFKQGVYYVNWFFCSFQYYGIGIIIKDDVGCLVCIVYNGRYFVCINDNYFFVCISFDEVGSGSQGIEEV